ncbi:tripartite tricarboxylate transporter substrate-binding protein [Pseudorhodoferax sp. Leaf265]|uniref:tripartite tricarboxylate transporter substrate-binding protein n=1 Tax=Pseudorhodoferax sp. Leaf265 TaxID=1736315 RepID=UPI0006FC469D|nr:tripartite tricarboxylate transporter substrate-binding protein [Pseudorhodoferax sp. Leaf265]KQP17574.1 twin-arginine translocation pathway signal protein [Pseudorhodoferax sp. Leaf265]PZP91796.1 MAG: twin-arginine translocation pathway signal protein [Variovorax paradoxus]PZQ01806.1 MAG: twin-arginine translocation pathway signal protein [Variovorax paradoxus]
MQHRRHFLQALGSAAALSALSPLSALAQVLDQVKIMYGFPAGSAGDSVARRVAEKLGGTPYSKNPGYVENKPGAGGRIAVESLKAAPADGSVLTLAPVSALAVYPYIYPKLSYKPEEVTQVSIGAIMFHGLAVGPAVPAEVKTLKDFLAWAKANPDKASYGSPGAGSMPHLLGALLGIRAGVDLKHVPYRGTVPSITDLVGGQIAAAMNPSGDYLQYMKTGRVRVLATSGKQRSPFLPEVPTFTELGYPDVTSEEWFGFYAPAKTPAATIAAANAAITTALKDKTVVDALAIVGLVAHGSTPQEMAADQKAEFERWGPLVKQIGFTAES